VLIAGVDLAAEPKGTALAVIDWSANSAKLVDLRLGVADADIVAVAQKVEKLGIDCALGWPVQFVDFLNRINLLEGSGEAFNGDLELRRALAYRETDRHVRAVTGRWPLSVSTDRLGMTAIRCAGLLSQLAHSGVPIDRSGGGKVVEIYPGASLRIWGLRAPGYRASAELRTGMIDDLRKLAPYLDLDDAAALMIKSCDAFDAVIAALAARSAFLGHYEKPAPAQLQQAKTEGWVALPNQPLSSLIG
jgi:predicted nuclease with RNAse H fold